MLEAVGVVGPCIPPLTSFAETSIPVPVDASREGTSESPRIDFDAAERLNGEVTERRTLLGGYADTDGAFRRMP